MTSCPATIDINGVTNTCYRDHGPRMQGDRHAARCDPHQPRTTNVYWTQNTAPPERDWQEGDVVLDDDECLFIRRSPQAEQFTNYPWIGWGSWCADKSVARPLTRLVPEREPVDLGAFAYLIRDSRRGGGTSEDIAAAVCEHLGLETSE